jgi:hypothetical protein
MHATHNPRLASSGLVDLYDLAVAKQGLKFPGAEEAEELAAVIAVGQGLRNLDIGQGGVEDLHAAAQATPELTTSVMEHLGRSRSW